MYSTRFATLCTVFCALTFRATSAFASPGASSDAPLPAPESAKPTSFHVDAETDPTAFILDGYSLHLGLGYGRLRLDLGVFAMKVPSQIHGNKDFDVSFDGFGAKLHYFVFADQKHLFAGIDTGVNRMLAERKGSDLAVRQEQYGIGAHVGWRIPLPAGFYVTPWVGVSHSFNASDITLGGATFKSNPVTIFPAIHLGYRFE